MNKKLPMYYEIEFEKEGIKYRGGYRIRSGKFPTITASYGGKEKTTQLGGNDAESLARLLITEMIAEERNQKAKEVAAQQKTNNE